MHQGFLEVIGANFFFYTCYIDFSTTSGVFRTLKDMSFCGATTCGVGTFLL